MNLRIMFVFDARFRFAWRCDNGIVARLSGSYMSTPHLPLQIVQPAQRLLMASTCWLRAFVQSQLLVDGYLMAHKVLPGGKCNQV